MKSEAAKRDGGPTWSLRLKGGGVVEFSLNPYDNGGVVLMVRTGYAETHSLMTREEALLIVGGIGAMLEASQVTS